MASGGGSADGSLPQVSGILPHAPALHLVAAGDPHHQDRLLLYHTGDCQRGEDLRNVR